MLGTDEAQVQGFVCALAFKLQRATTGTRADRNPTSTELWSLTAAAMLDQCLLAFERPEVGVGDHVRVLARCSRPTA